MYVPHWTTSGETREAKVMSAEEAMLHEKISSYTRSPPEGHDALAIERHRQSSLPSTVVIKHTITLKRI